ncbi:MAG: hypothetical protein ACR2JB_07405 [Bryobacteraceae bacterium]
MITARLSHLSLPINLLIRRTAPYLLLIAIAIFYSAFLTRTYYWDGVLFSLYIEGVHRGELAPAILLHPNHLVYSALGYLLYSTALACGLELRSLTLLQILNVVVSIGAGFVVFGLSKRITRSSSIALFCWLLFAFGATWWKFSTDADSYILSVLFLVLTIWFALRNPARIIPAAVCHILAMLFHELAVFTYVPVIAAIALDFRWSKIKKFWTSLIYVIGTGVCVGGGYLVAYSQADRLTYPSLFSWITSYASDAGFTHSLAEITGSYLTSYIKLFLGGKLSLIRDYFSVALCLSLAISVCMLIWALFLFRRTRACPPANPNARAIFVLWMWLFPSAIFLAFWGPGSAFYKLFVWPPIVLLIGVYIASRKRLNQHVHAFQALAVAIAAWNFGAFIYPHSHTSADPVLVFAQTLDRQLPRDATVYYRVLDPDDWYLEYFAPGRKWLTLPPRIESWQQHLPSSTRGPVCLETTALDELEKNPRAARLGLEADTARRWDLVNSQHNIRLECLKSTR